MYYYLLYPFLKNKSCTIKNKYFCKTILLLYFYRVKNSRNGSSFVLHIVFWTQLYRQERCLSNVGRCLFGGFVRVGHHFLNEVFVFDISVQVFLALEELGDFGGAQFLTQSRQNVTQFGTRHNTTTVFVEDLHKFIQYYIHILLYTCLMKKYCTFERKIILQKNFLFERGQ